jgi:hypothetical protein
LRIIIATKTILQPHPPSTNFGDLSLGTVTNASVLIKRLDDRKLTITRVESSNPSISAEVLPAEPADSHQVRLLITAKAEGMPRRVSERLRAFTDDSIGAALIYFVNARFIGDIKLDPEALVWGMPDPAENSAMEEDVILSRSFIVSATKPKQSLTVRNLSCTLPDVKLKLTTLEKNQYQIEATLAHRLKQSIKGTIHFETNLASLPTVDVPLEINVWKQ